MEARRVLGLPEIGQLVQHAAGVRTVGDLDLAVSLLALADRSEPQRGAVGRGERSSGGGEQGAERGAEDGHSAPGFESGPDLVRLAPG